MKIALLTLGGVLLFLANLLAWVQCTLLDSSEFQERTSAALDEPRARERTAEVIAAAVADSGRVDQAIDERLTDDLMLLAPVLKSQLENGLTATAERVLQSDAFTGVRDDATRRLHALVLGVLRDERALGAREDQIVLDVSEFVPAVVEDLGLRAAERAGGADSNTGGGSIVLVQDASAVRGASFIARNTDAVAVLLAMLSAGLFLLAIVRMDDVRLGLRRTGYVVLAVGGLTMLLVFVVNQTIASAYSERVVLQELVRSLLGNLRLQALVLALGGIVVAASVDRRVHAFAENSWTRTKAYIERTGVPAPLVLGIGAVLILLLI